MKTSTKFLKYRNLFKAPTAPNLSYPRRWGRALTKLHNKLGKDFIDRDEIIEEKIVGLDLKLQYEDKINEAYFPLISNLSNYFECMVICTKTVDRESPGILTWTITIVGYHQDATMLLHILSCAINGTDLLRWKLQEKYRSSRIRQRRKGTTKYVSHTPAKVRASQNYYIAIETITSITYPLLAIRKFGDLHRVKMKIIGDKVQDHFRLNYRYPNAKEHKLKHAYTRNKFCNGRIIQQ